MESLQLYLQLWVVNKVLFFDFTIDGDQYEFQAFEGIDTGFLAYPFLQVGVGLWQETELLLRYSPNIKIDKSDYAIYGIGVKHNVSQYIFKDDRPVELAFLTSYSLFDLNLFFDPYDYVQIVTHSHWRLLMDRWSMLMQYCFRQ